MVSAEWSILSGVITAAFAGGIAWASMKVDLGTRLKTVEKFVDGHDSKDVSFRMHCHDEVLAEIRELRRIQDEQFVRVNDRFDQAITFRKRATDRNGGS